MTEDEIVEFEKQKIEQAYIRQEKIAAEQDMRRAIRPNDLSGRLKGIFTSGFDNNLIKSAGEEAKEKAQKEMSEWSRGTVHKDSNQAPKGSVNKSSSFWPRNRK
jgi:hypothetical protein